MKTWLITGASSGFGRIMTEHLLERGDHVVATVRREGSLDDLVRRHGEALRVHLLDVSDTAAVRRTVDRAFGDAGRIDVVVSNAGYGTFGAAEELSDEQIDRQIATNLTGSIQLIRASLPHLRSRAAAVSSSCPRPAGRSPIRTSASTMPPNGASKASLRPSRRRSARSASTSCWSSRGRPAPASARTSTAPSRCRNMTRHPRVRYGGSSRRAASGYATMRPMRSTASSRRPIWTGRRCGW